MPYIRLSTSAKIDAAQAWELKAGLARAVELIPGKTEGKLMVELCGNQTMFYRGEVGDFAFIDAKFSGAVGFDDKKRFAEAALKLAEDVLGLPRGNANLTISCYGEWGTMGTLLGR